MGRNDMPRPARFAVLAATLTFLVLAGVAAARLGFAGAAVGELEAPLLNAALLGPSELAVQRTVADFGLAIYRDAGPRTREVVAGMLAAGMRRDPAEFMQIAQRRGRLDVACSHFDG